MGSKKCEKHNKEFTLMCLAENCPAELFLCSECSDLQLHKHSRTDIVVVQNIKKKIEECCEPKDSQMEKYFKSIEVFYEKLKTEINKVIEEDRKAVLDYLIKVKYYHLPTAMNSSDYLKFMKGEYDKLDKKSVCRLVNEAESSELNKNEKRQKEISNLLDIELTKVQDKILTLKYVLLAKKIEAHLLTPDLSEESKVAYPQDFVKISSLLNSRRMLMRSGKLIFRESDGSNFYNRCNGIVNTLTVVKTKDNKLVGGFTPLPLVYHDSEQMTESLWAKDTMGVSFIFSLTNLKTFSLKDNTKAVKYLKDQKGPHFGEDLVIDQNVTSDIGHSYESAGIAVDSLEAKVFLLENVKAQIKDFEVWEISF